MLSLLLLSAFVGEAVSHVSCTVPDQAQVIDSRISLVLDTVLPPAQFNATNLFLPPGLSVAEAAAKPFHIYDSSFLNIIGESPRLTLLAQSATNPLYHEAVVWHPATDEVFFVQNAGAAAVGTGLNKSAIIQKVSLAEAAEVAASGNASARVDVVTVNAQPTVINPNGGTNYRGNLVFTGEGQGDNIAPALYAVNPVSPYNSTILVNNFFGRQFTSLNDVAVNPRNGELYFTDPDYGYVQAFRPLPGLPAQIYRLNTDTGSLTVVADGFDKPNGLTFSPDGTFAYVTDTGVQSANYGLNFSAPATIYRFAVDLDGTFSSRKTFAYVSPGFPDGIHCDTWGNVYAGAGDGIQVWNPAGTLIGKIYLGTTSANFRFAGKGRMVIAAETKLYYVELAAEGADPKDQFR